MQTVCRYKIIVAYTGTTFCGWQTQKNGISVSSALEAAFKNVFNSTIKLIGASRTDAGVHARGQVALFTTQLAIAPDVLLRAWNNSLPDDITICSLTRVDDTFHPQYDAVQKTYWYHFFLERPLPFYKPYGLYVPYPVDFGILEQALTLFKGTHDFRSFCSNTDDKSTVRTVDALHVEYDEAMKAYRIVVKARGFLHHMVRRMVGAALYCARTDIRSVESIVNALQHPDAQQTLPNAPAHGLMLAHIAYTKEIV